MHADVFDVTRVEPDVVVGAGRGCDAADVVVPPAVFDGPRVEVDGSAAAMLPHPVRHRMAVADAQRMDDRSDAGQVSPAGSEPVPPASPLGRIVDHGIAQMRHSRPALAVLAYVVQHNLELAMTDPLADDPDDDSNDDPDGSDDSEAATPNDEISAPEDAPADGHSTRAPP